MISNQSIIDLYRAKLDKVFPEKVALYLFRNGAYTEKVRLDHFPFDAPMKYGTHMNLITGDIFTVHAFESIFFSN